MKNMSKLQLMGLYLISMTLIVSLVVVTFKGLGLRFNLTPSFPIGVYKLVEPHKHTSFHQKGKLVLVCPPNTAKFHINNHDFLTADSECSTNTIPLIKKIVAIEGDIVRVDNYVWINDKLQPNSKVYRHDHLGSLMNPCYGERNISKGFIWLMSDYYEKSFDSRYFCDVSEKNIIGAIKPIFVVR